MLPWTPLALAAIPPIVNWAKARRPLASRTWRMLDLGVPAAGVLHGVDRQAAALHPADPAAARRAARRDDHGSPARPQRPRLCWLQGPAAIVAALLGGAVVPALPGPTPCRRWYRRFSSSRQSSRSPSPRRSCWPRRSRRGARVVPAAVAICRRAHAGRASVRAVTRRARPRAGHGHAGHGTPDAAGAVATYRVFVRNLVFYTGVKQTDLRSDQQVVDYLHSTERVLCVIDEKNLRRLEEGAGSEDDRAGRRALLQRVGGEAADVPAPRPASRPRARAARRQPVTATERTSRHGDAENTEHSRVPLPCVPAACCQLREYLPRIQNAVRIECGLHAFHERNHVIRELEADIRLLRDSRCRARR